MTEIETVLRAALVLMQPPTDHRDPGRGKAAKHLTGLLHAYERTVCQTTDTSLWVVLDYLDGEWSFEVDHPDVPAEWIPLEMFEMFCRSGQTACGFAAWYKFTVAGAGAEA
jgi:hypothetical protein